MAKAIKPKHKKASAVFIRKQRKAKADKEFEKQKDRVQVQQISGIIATRSAKNALESLGLGDDEVTKRYIAQSAQTKTPSSPAPTTEVSFGM